MSQTTPPGPRHARFDEPEPPTTAIPTLPREEFTDDTTQAAPGDPGAAARRRAARVEPPTVCPLESGQPAGVFPVATVPPAPPRRRVLPAVLAGVTACLLVAGVAVGVTGAAGADLDQAPTTSATP